ncbi:MAG: NAD(P)/FAD-dependent oxidoreductase [Candidatus Puniceispirillaceae bacterium]
MSHYVVIGASHAGLSFAEKMRQAGAMDEITVIDRLAGTPVQRPPLSKAYLSSDAADDSAFHLRSDDWFDTQNITLKSGSDVTAIDRVDKAVHLADGDKVSYDRLILATGAVPRRLPMPEMECENVFVLRHGDDAKSLRAAITTSSHAVVIGGGYIGLEAAASLSKAGLKVDVIEAAPRLLARVASEPISELYQSLHESHNVAIHVGIGVSGLIADKGKIAGVALADGTEISCDLLLVGIGVVPDMGLAETAGLATGNGILTNHDYQTDDDNIFAIGDVVLADGRGDSRMESIHNAQYSAHFLASQFTNSKPPMNEAPWFWSDQYDRKLQSAGLVPAPADDVIAVRRPGKREGGVSVWCYQGGQLRSVESINDPQAYMIGKLCLEKEISPSPDDIVNPEFDLKSLR